jgi:hypothetical protein
MELYLSFIRVQRPKEQQNQSLHEEIAAKTRKQNIGFNDRSYGRRWDVSFIGEVELCPIPE